MKYIITHLWIIFVTAFWFGNTQAAVDLTALPLGDNLLSTAPKVGYLWPCITGMGGGGAFANGPWFNADGITYDLTKKVTVSGSVSWSHQYSTYVNGSNRVFSTNDLPDHTTGTYPIASNDDAYLYDRNPNSISAQQIQFSLTANPTVAVQTYCTPGAVGILLTGAVLFNAVDAGDRDAVAHEVQDNCQGHPQESGVYHYHSVSTCSSDTTDTSQHSNLIGYAVDGFGIYGHRGENGVELSSADLDECHGHTHTITWDGQQVSMYHYHATWDFPYTVGCLRGAYSQSVVMAISNGTSVATSTPTSIASSPSPTKSPLPSKSPAPTVPTATKLPTPTVFISPTQSPTPTAVSSATVTLTPTIIPTGSYGVIQKVTGASIKESAGTAVAYLGDINHDGFGDYAIGAPLFDVIANGRILKDAGRVLIISGHDGTSLFTLLGEQTGEHFGAALSGNGDVDGDGINDAVVGAYLADSPTGVTDVGRITVFSGSDMSVLYQRTGRNVKDYFGYAVALTGDVDGDHKSDVAIGAYLSDKNNVDGHVIKNAGSVSVFTGSSGTLYHTYWGTSPNGGLGFSIASAGDVDNDGFDDVIVGAPFSGFSNLKNSGSVYIYSPHKDAQLGIINGTTANSAFGSSVSSAGDINHDGEADVMVGAKFFDVPFYDSSKNKTVLLKDAGAAFVYSAVSGVELSKIVGKNKNENLGSAVSSAGDINDDGYDDVVVGIPNEDSLISGSTKTVKDVGKIIIFSGLSKTILLTEQGNAAADYFGTALAHGDINHDGIDDVLVGAPGSEAIMNNIIVKEAGAVSVISVAH